MSHSHDTPAESSFWPYRHLAIRVLVRALLDVRNQDGAAADLESARTFLNGSGMLLLWCQVAGVNPTVILKLAEEFGGDRPARKRTRPIAN